MLRQSKCSAGYPRVNLSQRGKFDRVKVHRIAALAFIGPIPEGLHVCHCDGDPSNNRIENLRIDTPAGAFEGGDPAVHGLLVSEKDDVRWTNGKSVAQWFHEQGHGGLLVSPDLLWLLR